jgi:hypothetical protein
LTLPKIFAQNFPKIPEHAMAKNRIPTFLNDLQAVRNDRTSLIDASAEMAGYSADQLHAVIADLAKPFGRRVAAALFLQQVTDLPDVALIEIIDGIGDCYRLTTTDPMPDRPKERLQN